MATRTIVPPTTNLLGYLAYLENANTFHEHQLNRAAFRIRELEAELAESRGRLVIRNSEAS